MAVGRDRHRKAGDNMTVCDVMDNPQYRYFVMNANGKIISGWEYQEDAQDAKRDPTGHHNQEDAVLPLKVITRIGLQRRGII